jgi:hypothetical protein
MQSSQAIGHHGRLAVLKSVKKRSSNQTTANNLPSLFIDILAIRCYTDESLAELPISLGRERQMEQRPRYDLASTSYPFAVTGAPFKKDDEATVLAGMLFAAEGWAKQPRRASHTNKDQAAIEAEARRELATWSTLTDQEANHHQRIQSMQSYEPTQTPESTQSPKP